MILDSSILIADERGRFALQDFFAAYSGDNFYLAAITVSELWHGVKRAVPVAPASRRPRLIYASVWLTCDRHGFSCEAWSSLSRKRHGIVTGL